MIKKPQRAAKPDTQGSHKVSPNAKTHRAETFATGAITTITNQNAASFNYGGFKILFSCWRTFDKVRIQKVFPRDSVPGFSNTVDVDAMGVRLYCNETLCSIFPMEGQELQPGQTYHHFLLREGDKEMMASVSLDIKPVTKPCAARYTRDVQFRAAFAAFQSKIDAAHEELRQELEHLLSVYTDKIDAVAIPPKETPVVAVRPRATQTKFARKAGYRIGAKA